MSILAISFVTPALLAGLLAAGIPPLLHLLNSRRATEAPLPTLRLLQMSVRRTAKRRTIQHWALMILRSAMMAALAIAAAQLVIRTGASFWGADRYAAVLIIDNSYSMQTASGPSTRLHRASSQARSLLSGPAKPHRAAVLQTNTGSTVDAMTTVLAPLRKDLEAIEPASGSARLSAAVTQAIALLESQDLPDKRIYIFSDLQRVGFDDLAGNQALADHPQIRLMIADASGGPPSNVGLTALTVRGAPVVDQTIHLAATVTADGPAEQRVAVRFEIDGKTVGPPRMVTVGADASRPEVVLFSHTLDTPGVCSGRVVIEIDDDLAEDDQRWFSFPVADRPDALIIGGPPRTAALDDGAMVLHFALDPRDDENTPWSIRPRLVRFDAFEPTDLDGTEAVFCDNVPSFTAPQAVALTDYVVHGGAVAFFLGADVNAANYNEHFANPDAPLLPGRLGAVVGELGLRAPARPIETLDLTHRYLSGLGLTADDGDEILTQRSVRIEAMKTPPDRSAPDVLMRLAGGDPLVMTHGVGNGRVMLCTTTASLQWTGLPSVGLSVFVPMLERFCLDGVDLIRVATSAGEPVDIAIPDSFADGAVVTVTDPQGLIREAPVEEETARVADTVVPGVYRWEVRDDRIEAHGAFAVGLDSAEFDLSVTAPREIIDAIGEERCFVAATVAELHAEAAGRSAGVNLSEVFLVAVAAALVVEAALSNRRTRRFVSANPAEPWSETSV